MINGPTTQIQQIYQMLLQLVYKPSVKGSAGEQILADMWPQYFNKDLLETGRSWQGRLLSNALS
jgi:hypothetical protein